MRPVLNAKPPLRGDMDRNSIALFHQQIAFAVATQSLKARSTP